MSRRLLLSLVAVLLAPAIALACMWDSDTIRMERERFPSALELITGKFLRHSPEFYHWRIENRLKRLQADPNNLPLLDDLAVAYDKTGQHQKAIDTALAMEKLEPNRYETAANLGTFYLHNGEYAKGISAIKRALVINPDAHFGREKVQLQLAEYLVARRKADPNKLPLADVKIDNEYPSDPIRSRIEVSGKYDELYHKSYEPLLPEQYSDLSRGLLGMMKFGQHDSPILLEALGSVLAAGDTMNPHHDAKLLAARAYLKASYAVPAGPSREAYRNMATKALSMQMPNRGYGSEVILAEVEAKFQQELAEAQEWYDRLHELERTWIATGMDPDAEFNRLYASEPEVSGMDVPDPMSPGSRAAIYFAQIVFALILVLIAMIAGMLWLWRRLYNRVKATRNRYHDTDDRTRHGSAQLG